MMSRSDRSGATRETRRRRRAVGVAAVAALAAGGAIFLAERGGHTASRVVDIGGSPPQGVGIISAAAFEQRGIYLGPPGTIPTGVPSSPNVAPPTTLGTGSPTTQPAASAEQLAVQGDPANGTTTVSATEALTTAQHNLGGFVPPVTWGTPVLVQLDNIYASIVATAWAIPVTGTALLSGGPAAVGGSSITMTPSSSTTAVVFVDAVTGHFISEEGFSS